MEVHVKPFEKNPFFEVGKLVSVNKFIGLKAISQFQDVRSERIFVEIREQVGVESSELSNHSLIKVSELWFVMPLVVVFQIAVLSGKVVQDSEIRETSDSV